MHFWRHGGESTIVIHDKVSIYRDEASVRINGLVKPIDKNIIISNKL
jgi:hypothetical protein